MSVALFGLVSALPALAQQVVIEEGGQPERRPLIIPYVFYTERMAATFGGFGGVTGSPQPQSSWFLSPFVTSNGTFGAIAGIWDYQMPFCERLFARAYGSIGRWERSRAYTPLGPFDPSPRPGRNDSRDGDFVDEPNFEVWVNTSLRYVLPIGHGRGRNNAVARYVVRDGLLVSGASGGESWNPLESGYTFLQIEPFFQRQEYDVDFDDDRIETLGFKIGVDHDNRNFRSDPSRGHRIQVNVSFDPGWLSKADDWTFWEIEASKYFSLGSSAWFRQAVVALDFWTGATANGDTPYFSGARLGGYFRLRGFEINRFNDDAVVAYTAELRLTPHWNPVPHIDLLGGIDVDWLQFVLFGEAGRVASGWSVSGLHRDIKWDLGVGLRAMIQKAVFRLDVAGSEEGARLVAMVSHPF